MLLDEAISRLRQKHLDYIQAIVTRLAGNSFLVRAWSVTIVAAVLGFARDRADWRFALIALPLAGTFWYLDAFYLWQELRFRTLHDRVRLAPLSQLQENPYFLNPVYSIGARVFPPAAQPGIGQAIPAEVSQFEVAGRDGMWQFHTILLGVITVGVIVLLTKA